MKKVLALSLFVLLTLTSYTQDLNDFLAVIKISISETSEQLSSIDHPIALIREENDFYVFLKANNVNVLTRKELFNRGYCYWLKLEKISVRGKIATIEYSIKSACSDRIKLNNLIYNLEKNGDKWVVE